MRYDDDGSTGSAVSARSFWMTSEEVDVRTNKKEPSSSSSRLHANVTILERRQSIGEDEQELRAVQV
jgi:hypothetical protein